MTEDNSNLSFLDHLDQLRSVILKMLALLGLFCIPCWFISQSSIDLLLSFAAPKDFPMHYFSLMEPFVTRIKVTAFLSLVITLPFNARLLWHFLEPALLPDERPAVIGAAVCIWLLALFGSAVALLFIVPAMIRFSLSFSGPEMQPVIGIGDFVGTVLAVLLAAMALFQFPVILYLLLKLGFVNLPFLKKKRPHAIVMIFILAAVFSPPDVLSQLLLAIPSWLLFEGSLLYFSRHFHEHDTSYEDIYVNADQQTDHPSDNQ